MPPRGGHGAEQTATAARRSVVPPESDRSLFAEFAWSCRPIGRYRVGPPEAYGQRARASVDVLAARRS